MYENNLHKIIIELFKSYNLLFTKKHFVKYFNEFNNSFVHISNSLDEYGIRNVAVKATTKEIFNISIPAIAQCSREVHQFYVLIKSVGKDDITIFDSEQGLLRLTLDEFGSIFKGNVLLLDINELSGEKEYHKNKKKESTHLYENVIIIFLLSLVSISAFLISENLIRASLLLALILGLLISIALLSKDLGGLKNNLLLKFCSLGKELDCDVVTKSSAGKVFEKLSWAEVGFFYFAGSTLSVFFSFLLNNNNILNILILLNASALPYTIFSVYYQKQIAKKWCPLCLAIQVMLILEFLLLFFNVGFILQISLNIQVVSSLIFSFGLPISIWLLIRFVFENSKEKAIMAYNLKQFKTDSYLFKLFLENQPITRIDKFSDEIVLGNHDATLEIVMITNPFCASCGVAHKELHAWTNYFSEDIRIIFRFFPSFEPNSKTNKLINDFFFLYQSNRFSEAFESWYENPNYEKWSKKYATQMIPNIDKVLDDQMNWCLQSNIKQTPAFFINGRELSSPYNYEDLKYHFRSLIDV